MFKRKKKLLNIKINEDLSTIIEISDRQLAKYILGYELKQVAMQKPTLILYVKYLLNLKEYEGNVNIIQVLQRR